MVSVGAGLLWLFSLLVMTMSFLVHEIAHKVMAQQAGMWAEFRLTTWGASVNACFSVFTFQNDCSGSHDDWGTGALCQRNG